MACHVRRLRGRRRGVNCNSIQGHGKPCPYGFHGTFAAALLRVRPLLRWLLRPCPSLHTKPNRRRSWSRRSWSRRSWSRRSWSRRLRLHSITFVVRQSRASVKTERWPTFSVMTMAPTCRACAAKIASPSNSLGSATDFPCFRAVAHKLAASSIAALLSGR